MNAHRSLTLLAALVVTAAQTLVFAVDTAASAQSDIRGVNAASVVAMVSQGSAMTAVHETCRYSDIKGA